MSKKKEEELEYSGPFKWSISILDYERWRAKSLGHLDVMREIEDAMEVLEQEGNERLDHPDEYLDSADALH